MNRILLVIMIACFAGSNLSTFAQEGDRQRRERFQKFQTERVQFISKKMKLTEEEKKAFWPLCDELQMKKFDLNRPIREAIRKIRRSQQDKTSVSEADYKKLTELMTEVKWKEAQLDKEYYTKFLKVISAEQYFLYMQAEQDYGREMMERRRDRN